MEKLKFRAKSLENNAFIYGDYYKKHIQTNNNDTKLEHYIGFQSTDENNQIWNEYYEISEETLGIFSERLDLNGKEIFSGDIVYCNFEDVMEFNSCYGVVKFNICQGCYVENLEDVQFKNSCLFDWDTIEIIGNIYDNKELLED